MRCYHRHSFFPLVVAVLTLLLSALLFYCASNNRNSDIGILAPPVVDASDYRADIASIVKIFSDSYAQAIDAAGRSDAGTKALHSLLDLRVPSEYKKLHLDLAILFSDVESAGYDGDAMSEIKIFSLAYPWLEL
jgi:hypothetical protein